MRGMPDESVDLIYLDPPFNKNKNFAAPIGSKAAGAEFKDMWTLDDVDVAWWGEIAESNETLYAILDAIGRTGGNDLKSYAIYMAIRLVEMHRILKRTGSIYLHCDHTASHSLKIIMDSIFDRSKFRNEIIWQRNTSHEDSKTFGNVSDIILFYGNDINKDAIRIPLDKETINKHYRYSDSYGHYRPENLKSGGLQGGGYSYMFHGHDGPWRCPESTMKRYESEGRIHFPNKKGGVPQRKRYLDKHPGIVPTNIWTDIKKARGKESLGYPTQKPLALLRRIILASSLEGDVILDPFCGCATACIAAEKLDRQWIGIDISEMAFKLIKRRLHDEYPIDQYTEKEAQLIARTEAPILQGTQSKNIKNMLYGEQKGNCAACEVHFPYRNLTIDHMVPTSKGGQDIDENKQLLCQSCNSMKGNKMTTTELKVKLVKIGIIQAI